MSRSDLTSRDARLGSILFAGPFEELGKKEREEPDFFHDLSLGPVVAAVTAGRQEYGLERFFYIHLNDLESVTYRQEVMRDMESGSLRRAVAAFAERLRAMRRHLAMAAKSPYELEKQRWKLAAVEEYVEAVEQIASDLDGCAPASRGLEDFRDGLAAYLGSDGFRALATETRAVAASLAAVRYCLLIRDGSATVRPYDGEADYSAVVEETFHKLRQGNLRSRNDELTNAPILNHVEAQILERVALLNPESFSALARFCERYEDYADPAVLRFDREIQFYAAYHSYAERFRQAGLSFCYPRLSDRRKQVSVQATFDVALADRLLSENQEVVCNDFFLQGVERVLVVTGPNQGGKTTFARTFGQVHYLASLGCPVPGREAELFLYDRLLTHFEREEDVTHLHGKLEDDLLRIRRILGRATGDSILIVNEIFSSTALEDALFLSREILARVLRLDLLCVCVTFLDELATQSEKTVSMVSAVDPVHPEKRTFKIERRPADGLAYALAIAEKRRVSYHWLQERIRP